VKDYDDKALLTLALVENLQRSDLNPIEEAEGIQSPQYRVCPDSAGDRRGCRQRSSTVANSLRLLNLPAIVRRMLQDGQLSVGHARALLAISSSV
jgi:ParB family chromosome partitioning protein